MKQNTFEALHQPFWYEFAHTITQMESGNKLSSEEKSQFAANYRSLCYHLALAQSRTYSSSLVEYLQLLTERAHRQFYRHKTHFLANIWAFIRRDFPTVIKEQWRFVLCAHVLFYGPFILFALIAYFSPLLLQDMLNINPEAQQAQFVKMYQEMADAQKTGTNRPLGDDWGMFAFYVWNNIGISFQMFAGGLTLAVGTIYILLFNGIMIGSTFGLMVGTPVSTAFFSFVIAHGAFELTGIVLAGAAGLKMGWILIKPGPYKRLDAFKRQGKPIIQIMSGGFLFLFIAAIIEGFWSPITSLPYAVKFSVGGCLWVLVYLYLILLGKRHEA
ncbi:stage II sporulation protein M [Neisseria sp. Ec49-e6-T10]|uniref:stage II sporulation protein M n=1 Tax=Neisseria sp. Ec49-e6-T10 TaxID=3140744 RepID=UPI003EBAF7E4